MKKRKKRTLLIVILIVVILAAIALIVFYPVLQMSPTETGYVSDTGVFALRNRGGAIYLIKTESGYIMIDAGSGSSGVEAVLSGQGISTGEVKRVFLTHSDSDHVASLPLFPDAEIYMGEDEIDLVNGTKEALIKATVPGCSDGFGAVRGKKRSNTSSITSIFNEEMRQIGDADECWGFNQCFQKYIGSKRGMKRGRKNG